MIAGVSEGIDGRVMMRGPWIHIVDDNNAVRSLLRRALAEAGYRVGEASGSSAAPTHASEHSNDLIVLGIDPQADVGSRTIRKIRELYTRDETAVWSAARAICGR